MGFWTAVALRWGCSLLTAFWLVVVFRRYETTVALPVEYGVVPALDTSSGLIFYNEYEHMEEWQIQTLLAGCAVCLLGVGVGLCDECISSTVVTEVFPDDVTVHGDHGPEDKGDHGPEDKGASYTSPNIALQP